MPANMRLQQDHPAARKIAAFCVLESHSSQCPLSIVHLACRHAPSQHRQDADHDDRTDRQREQRQLEVTKH
jgi:hypothetical protein